MTSFIHPDEQRFVETALELVKEAGRVSFTMDKKKELINPGCPRSLRAANN